MSKQINAEQKALVHSFAKTHKVNHAKLDNLMNEIFAAFPKGAHKGRVMSEKNVQLIEDLKGFSEAHKTEQFTMKALAEQLKADAATVTNLVKKMAQEGQAFVVGQAPKVAGVRGKVPALWSFTEPSKASTEVHHE